MCHPFCVDSLHESIKKTYIAKHYVLNKKSIDISFIYNSIEWDRLCVREINRQTERERETMWQTDKDREREWQADTDREREIDR